MPNLSQYSETVPYLNWTCHIKLVLHILSKKLCYRQMQCAMHTKFLFNFVFFPMLLQVGPGARCQTTEPLGTINTCFLHAGCPSCCSINSIKPMKGTRSTDSIQANHPLDLISSFRDPSADSQEKDICSLCASFKFSSKR